MFIPDPDFYPSRIPDPKTATKERGEKKLVVIPFYVATNCTKLYYFSFEVLKKTSRFVTATVAVFDVPPQGLSRNITTRLQVFGSERHV
jgi:hypothetical protein